MVHILELCSYMVRNIGTRYPNDNLGVIQFQINFLWKFAFPDSNQNDSHLISMQQPYDLTDYFLPELRFKMRNHLLNDAEMRGK